MHPEGKIPASVGILTLNAAEVLPETLEIARAFADVYICDGNSTDGTQDIARKYGARVERQFDSDVPNQKVKDFSAIFNRVMSFAKYDWYLRLDADERPTPELIEELRAIVTDPHPKARIYKIPRLYVWRGKVVVDSITYPNNQIRFFHRGAVKGFEKITHERLVPLPGEKVAITKHPMLIQFFDEVFSEGRIERALEWDRLQYEKYLTWGELLHAYAHTAYVMTLFGVRAIRVHLISRGHKFPLRYDWWRYRYMARANLLATRMMFTKTWHKLTGRSPLRT